MPDSRFAEQLARWGPQADYVRPSLVEAQEYCAELSRSHYENFTVASKLLPARLRTDFYNVYAYCRWSDDLADETSGGEEALSLLAWWERELDALYAGETRHPVFIALSETVRRFQIPRDPFADLLRAFRQDQTTLRYETYADLLDYCRYSANPVGRLVLYLDGSHRDETIPLSDAICTGLQLANFWQDVARDWRKGRIYLPSEDCRRFGYEEHSPDWGRATPAFRELMKFELDRTQTWFEQGEPLVKMVSPEMRIDIELFRRGGLAVLEAIRRLDYDVWSRRPTIGKLHKLRLLGAAWWSSRMSK